MRKIIRLPGKIKELPKFIKQFFGFEVLVFLNVLDWEGRVGGFGVVAVSLSIYRKKGICLFCCTPSSLLHAFIYGRKVVFITTPVIPCSAPELLVLSQTNEDVYNSILQDNSCKSVLEHTINILTVLLMNTYIVQ